MLIFLTHICMPGFCGDSGVSALSWKAPSNYAYFEGVWVPTTVITAPDREQYHPRKRKSVGGGLPALFLRKCDKKRDSIDSRLPGLDETPIFVKSGHFTSIKRALCSKTSSFSIQKALFLSNFEKSSQVSSEMRVFRCVKVYAIYGDFAPVKKSAQRYRAKRLVLLKWWKNDKSLAICDEFAHFAQNHRK